MAWDISGGRLGRTALGMPVLELVTTGHRSGEERSILISYVETPDGPALAGTNAGAPADPAWVHNLRAYPEATIRRSGDWRKVRARFLQGDERNRVWADFLEAHEGYARYQEILERPIPIAVLEESRPGLTR